MCDLFLKKDAYYLLKDKRVLFLGDSNVRSYYKDLIYLLEENKLLSNNAMKNKLGAVVPADRLVKSTHLHRGRDYFEVRHYENRSVDIHFEFVTRCFCDSIVRLFRHYKDTGRYPHVVLMNSCLWDISRWGPNGVLEYKDNMVKLMKLLKKHLPDSTLFIWLTVPPISNKCKGGLLVKQVQFLEHSLRFDVMEGNLFARELVVSYGFDVLDIHYYLRMQIHRRAGDGIHWEPRAIRHITNLILTHISVALGVPLPGNVHGEALRRLITLAVETKKPTKPPVLPEFSSIKAENSKKAKILAAARPAPSPLRRAVKEKMERTRIKQYLGDEHDISTDSFVDISFEETNPLYTSFEDSILNWEEGGKEWDLKDLEVSPLPAFKREERRGISGPVRNHRSKYRFCPYGYN